MLNLSLQALVESKLDDKYASIRIATHGLIFFATPHQGGEYAKLGDIAAKIVRKVCQNPTNSFMEALKKDSLFADSNSKDFRNLLEDYYVLSFFETRSLGSMGLLSQSMAQV
jgi:hypothetical protein